MLRQLLSRLSASPPAPRMEPALGPVQPPAPPVGEGAAPASLAGPVFSSRAVRDAALVTGAIDALKRFADGQAAPAEIGLKLTSLSPDQFSFLQISADPGLLARAAAKAAECKGAKALELQRLLGDLTDADSAGRSLPHSPAPAVRSAPAVPAVPRPGAFVPSRPVLPAAPARFPAAAAVPGLSAPADADVPAPFPAPKPAVLPGTVPRMSKADAEARRARLMKTLTDQLSTTEAAR